MKKSTTWIIILLVVMNLIQLWKIMLLEPVIIQLLTTLEISENLSLELIEATKRLK